MAEKQSFKGNAALERILGKNAPSRSESSIELKNQIEETDVYDDGVEEAPVERELPHIASPKKKRGPVPAATPYKHKSYYVREEQHEALRLRAVRDSRLDISGHLRAALDLYLAKDIEDVRNKQF